MTYRDIVPITPNDTEMLPGKICHAIWCAGTPGNVVVVTADGTKRTLPIEAGFDKRITVKAMKVEATSTTATTLYACYT